MNRAMCKTIAKALRPKVSFRNYDGLLSIAEKYISNNEKR